MPNKIQLLCVENTLTAKQQTLSFLLAVENYAPDKKVDVIWAGEDGIWQTLSAEYRARRGDGWEYWQAKTVIRKKGKQSLPGNIQFALHRQTPTSEHWENQHRRNFFSAAGSGLTLPADLSLQNIDIGEQLASHVQTIAIKAASDIHASQVIVRWTTDDWRTYHETPCRPSPVRTPNSAKQWTVAINVKDVFRLQYCLQYQSQTDTAWDNNYGRNYCLSRSPLSVMILNLHCYQEEDQHRKFAQIAKAIDREAVDIVCFQEVAEYWNDGHGDWASNAANLINQRLKKPFHLIYDYSHLGFDRYREGIAILSRLPLQHTEARYVSDSNDIYNIHSRKVVMAQIDVPHIGVINVYSAHLSWCEDGFSDQFQRLSAWAQGEHGDEVIATLLCGDFNIAAGSVGYQLVVDDHQYEDQFLAANDRGLFDKIFRVKDAHWQHLLANDYRIDYIFMNKNSRLRTTTARVIFTEQDYGPVSDHVGYLMQFEPK